MCSSLRLCVLFWKLPGCPVLFRCLTTCLPASGLLLKCAKAQQVESQALSRIVASAPTTASWPWYNAMQRGPVESRGYTWKQVAILAGEWQWGSAWPRLGFSHCSWWIEDLFPANQTWLRKENQGFFGDCLWCQVWMKCVLWGIKKAVKLVLIQFKKQTWI